MVAPLCRLIEREPAAAYVIACASDPGIEAARSATQRPVFGVFRCAVAVAVARAERFGVIAIVEASKARHLAALRAMGLEGRLAAELALNVTMETLLQPEAARGRLIAAARGCVAAGAGTVILGCTGMAHHRAAVEDCRRRSGDRTMPSGGRDRAERDPAVELSPAWRRSRSPSEWQAPIYALMFSFLVPAPECLAVSTAFSRPVGIVVAVTADGFRSLCRGLIDLGGPTGTAAQQR